MVPLRRILAAPRRLSGRIALALVLGSTIVAAVVVSRRVASQAIAVRQSAQRVHRQLLEARIECERFLRRRASAPAQEAHRSLEDARAGIDALPSRHRPALAARVERATALWEDLVRVMEARGLDERSGAEGRLRAAVHAVEDALDRPGALRMQVHMLSARRAEKDFIMRRRAEYPEKLEQAIARLSASVRKSTLDAPTKAEIHRRSAEYLDHFDAFRRLLSEVDTRVEGLRRVQTSLTEEIAEIVDAETQRAVALSRLADALLVGGLAVSLLISVVLTQTVLRPVRRMRAAALKLSRGETDSHLPLRGGEELEALGEALNTAAAEIDARLQAQDRAAEARQFAQQVFESSNDGILVIDRALEIRMANRRVRELLAVSGDDLVGRSVFELLPASTRGSSARRLEATLAGEVTHNPDLELSVDGRSRWVMTTNVPLLDRSGRIEGVVSAITEVTERKLHELELERARERAEAADRAKTRFLDNISHEMRTPLNAVLGTTQLLGTQELEGELAESLDVVERAAEKLLSLIDAVISFSEVEGAAAADPTPCRASSLLERLNERARDRAQQTGTELRVVVDEPADVDLLLPEREVSRVLCQFLDNALEYAPGAPVLLEAKAHPDPGAPDRYTVALSIRDHGPGITPEVRARMFELFEQGDGTRSKAHGGLGIGLAVAERLARTLGGRIEVQGAPGEGATFRLVLDRIEGVTPEAPAAEIRADARETEAPVEPASLRVLVVEDNVVNQRVVRKMLERLGVTCGVADQGAAALDALRAEPFDLVLMDLQMPVMDGLEATRRIRAELPPERQPRIVALTANARASDERACREAGMDDFMAKPVRLPRLEKLIGDVAAG